MISTESAIEKMTLSITEEIRVQAPIDVTFATLIEQLGPFNETPEGQKMNMKIEAWPGGRWYRDLADGNGHFWGNVQAIKRPTLLEICGPLFMSYPVVSNLSSSVIKPGGRDVTADSGWCSSVTMAFPRWAPPVACPVTYQPPHRSLSGLR